MADSKHIVWAALLASLMVLASTACGSGAAPAPQPTKAPDKPAPAATAAPAAAPTAAAKATAAPAAAATAAPSGEIAKPAGYPSKPVQFIVPFDPGGGSDNAQRIFNKYAEPIVGQQLVIVNKPGAGGATGWAELVRAKPDGYTLTIVTPPSNIIPAVVQPKQTGYTMDQFVNIAIYAIVPDAIYVREESEFKTLKELVDFAKKNPEKIKAANAGAAMADHLTSLLIENATGTKFTHVPFTGGSQCLQATLAGTTEIMVASTNYLQTQKGKLRALAVASEKPDPQFGGVPTFKELGYDVVSDRYRALAGPPSLPKEIVTYWSQVAKKVVDIPEFKADMDKTGQPAAYRNPEESTKAIDKMTTDIKGIVDKYGLAKK